MSFKKNLLTHAAIILVALGTMACTDNGQNSQTDSSTTSLETMAGGNLSCYSDKNGNNKIWTGNSAHNCCTKRGGKSWSCDGGPVTKCSQNNDYHCP